MLALLENYQPIHAKDAYSGQSVEYLQQLKEKIMSAKTPILEMADTLELITKDPHRYTRDSDTLRIQGRFLIGQCVTCPDDEVDRLFYAEGEGLRQNGAFSVVRTAIWTNDSYHSPNTRITTEGLDTPILQSLIQIGLADIHKPDAWYAAAPVERTTRIAPLYPAHNEDPEGYVYGHKQDIETINQLAMPHALKQRILNTTIEWHEAELQQEHFGI